MKIALIGDSIRMGYETFVAGLLPDAEIISLESNGGDSRNHLDHFNEMYLDKQPEIIHFNCGLHDLRFYPDKQAHQVELDEYTRNLHELADRLKSLDAARIIWATTTPVVEERHKSTGREYLRLNRDVDAYNEAALDVMQTAGFEIDDLHAAVDAFGREQCICQDGVHMTEEGKQAIAKTVADCVRKYF